MIMRVVRASHQITKWNNLCTKLNYEILPILKKKICVR